MNTPRRQQPASGGAPRGRFDVRSISWKRVIGLVAVACVVAGAVKYFSENVLVANADGLVLRDRVVAAASYEARIKQVAVRSGDYVHEGATIAILESASMSRSLADLSAQKARLAGNIAHLDARRAATDALFPIAKANASRIRTFLDKLERSRDNGTTSLAYFQQITSEAYAADERLASLQAERRSADEELRQNRLALAEMETAYQNLKLIYADGVMVALASGYVGAVVAQPGDVLMPGGKVLEIHTGRPFVLAYLADRSFPGVSEGDRVQVSSARQTTHATVQKILPMVEALPPEFQKPVHARESGQLLRISLAEEDGFVTNQKVRINSCSFADCSSLGEVVVRAASTMIAGLSDWVGKHYAATVEWWWWVAQHADYAKSHPAGLAGASQPAKVANKIADR
jgi:multidrug resistance efflux pump